MLETFLMSRRKKLGMPTRTLVRMSGVPVATVNRILTNPGRVRFEYVAAVARVLGVDMEAGKTCPPPADSQGPRSDQSELRRQTDPGHSSPRGFGFGSTGIRTIDRRLDCRSARGQEKETLG